MASLHFFDKIKKSQTRPYMKKNLFKRPMIYFIERFKISKILIKFIIHYLNNKNLFLVTITINNYSFWSLNYSDHKKLWLVLKFLNKTWNDWMCVNIAWLNPPFQASTLHVVLGLPLTTFKATDRNSWSYLTIEVFCSSFRRQ